jgi:hypothetical protein
MKRLVRAMALVGLSLLTAMPAHADHDQQHHMGVEQPAPPPAEDVLGRAFPALAESRRT